VPATGVGGGNLIGRMMPRKATFGTFDPMAGGGTMLPGGPAGKLMAAPTGADLVKLLGVSPDDEAGFGKIGSVWGDEASGTLGKLDASSIVMFPPEVDLGPGVPPDASAPPGRSNTDRFGDGAMASLGGSWSNVDRWNDGITQAQQQAYEKTGVWVPGNVIKSIMRIESNGEWQSGQGDVSPHGYFGLMQVGPGSWGYGTDWDPQRAFNDPYYNIFAGTMELARRYNDAMSQNPGYDWSNVAVGYFSGHYSPNGAHDGFNSDYNYQRMFQDNLGQLGGLGGTSGYTNELGGTGGGGMGVAAIWGGQGDYPITQDMGLTDFARGNALYDYARAYHGFEGHPGLDIGTPYGTSLYTPVGGTVVFGGGSGYYANNGNAGPGVGEFRIRLDNGDELILGHMSQISVRPGQRLQAGAYIGQSGSENGAHVHVEYRQADGQGGFYIADPREVLNGYVSPIGGGGTSGGSAGYGMYESPMQRMRRYMGGGA
jgi:murein DD-endopeptidase MepM/ murein hydrolase activator NlpD